MKLIWFWISEHETWASFLLLFPATIFFCHLNHEKLFEKVIKWLEQIPTWDERHLLFHLLLFIQK